MNVAYGIVAGLLALFHLYGGGVKVVRSRERLRPMMAWVDTSPMPAVRAIGVLEVRGSGGLQEGPGGPLEPPEPLIRRT
ncbi:hypothetical protein Strvi_4327 [Streptomyces violaceusniger Tu 4113]|uniref:Uncharacterized protein n=1 Tax=Streptomyces violaceusniger (strain Tu 4113) TaxID=653045 RepID=G2P4T7_STRV4|nr:hypothetical protein Strvi_4327 [Streptomyces violaceusniger Tu 4113]